MEAFGSPPTEACPRAKLACRHWYGRIPTYQTENRLAVRYSASLDSKHHKPTYANVVSFSKRVDMYMCLMRSNDVANPKISEERRVGRGCQYVSISVVDVS